MSAHKCRLHLGLLSIALAGALFSGCVDANPDTGDADGSGGGKSDGFEDELVRLSKATIVQGCSSCFSLKVDVVIKNLAFEKQVVLVYGTTDLPSGDVIWQEAPGVYAGPLSSSHELWTIEVPTDARLSGRVELAVKYRVNGKDYWDNNCGENFVINALELGQGGTREIGGRTETCGPAVAEPVLLENVKIVQGCSSCFALTANVDVENLGFSKRVVLAYGVDLSNGQIAWEAVDGMYVVSRPANRELWRIQVPTDARLGGRVRLAVKYEVSSREHWDNNCGNDYVIPALQLGQGGTRELVGRSEPCI